jgi:hypothetical protein
MAFLAFGVELFLSGTFLGSLKSILKVVVQCHLADVAAFQQQSRFP